MSTPVSINIGLLALTAGAAFLAGNAFSNTAAARWRSWQPRNMVPMTISRRLGHEMARKQPAVSLRTSRAHWSQYLKVPFTRLTTWHRIQGTSKMSVIGKVVKVGAALFAVLTAVAFVPNLLDIRPVGHPPKPVVPFEGNLAPNTALNRAEKLFHSHIIGPESIAVYKGQVYTGLHSGWIVRIKDDNKLEFIVSLGDPKCKPWEEARCGRPLGLRFTPNGDLFVMDAYKGLVKVDVQKGTATVVQSRLVPVQGGQSLIPNHLDVSSKGDIYWSDSSHRWPLSTGLYEFLEMGPNGRLLHYDPKTNTSKVLIDNLHFANGVQLSPKEDFVLVAETFNSRILKYHLTGPKKGTTEVFVDNLPGGADNIRSNGRGGYWIGICMPVPPKQVARHNIVTGYPTLRKVFARIVHLIRQGLGYLDGFLDSCFLKTTIYKMAHMQTYTPLTNPTGLVLELDSDGKIIRSLHSPDGQVPFVSEAAEHNGYLYLGSPWNNFLGKLKL